MKILITSISSYVGRYIAMKLASSGEHEIVGTYRTPKNIDNRFV